jgi:CheY-like chemotaxis protein
MKVLVIEDDEASIELLTLRLESLGCEVIAAGNPADGLRLAREAVPDLMIVDLKMEHDPGRGIALVREIKAEPRLAGVPLAVHSVFVAHPGEAPAALPEVEAYLPKPFKLAELRALVDRVRGGATSP